MGPPLGLALDAAQAALAACSAAGYKVGVTVIDSSGQPRVGLTADGARGGNIYTAVRKSLTALEFRKPTSQVSLELQSNPALVARIKPGMMPWAGAVPLFAGDRIIGAIGVSGATSVQDEKCARLGAAKIADRLGAIRATRGAFRAVLKP